VSFAFLRQSAQRLVEAGLLGAVPSLCLLEMARSLLKHWTFIEVTRVDPEKCAYFVPTKEEWEAGKSLKRFGVLDGI